MNYYVEIVCFTDGGVEKRMGPMSAHAAEKVARGVDINLNHERFYTRITSSVKASPPSQKPGDKT